MPIVSVAMRVNFIIDDKLKATLKDRFPGHEIVSKDEAKTFHPHPVLACERRITEQLAHDTIASIWGDSVSILDVGGSARRNASRPNVWTCNPILSPEDDIRNLRNQNMPRRCQHLGQICNCVKYDVALCVHSGYYLTADDVLLLLSKCKAVLFVQHMFPDIKGVLGHGEATYSVNVDGLVEMRLKGNHQPYRHDCQRWLYSSHYTGELGSMSWSVEHNWETCQILFVKSQLVGSNFNQPNGDCEIMSRYSQLLSKTSTCYAAGGLFFFVDHGSSVVVPKWVVDLARTKIMGQDRNEDSFATLLQYVRKKVIEKEGIDSESAIRIMTACRVAFLYDVESEVGNYRLLIDRHKEMQAINTSRQFNKQGWNVATVAAAIATIAGTAMMAKSQSKTKVALSIGAFYFILHNLNKIKNKGNDKNNVVSVYKQERSSSITVCGVEMNNLPCTTVDKELVKIRDGAFLQEPETPVDKEDKDGLFPIGATFSNHLPIVLSSNYINEKTAVVNRCLMEVPEPTEDVFSHINYSQYIDVQNYKNTEVVTYAAWNRNFPDGRRKQHDKAYLQYQTEGLCDKDFTRNAFVKKEKYNKTNIMGVDMPDPRLIQGVGHVSNVVLGPVMKRFSKYLSNEWSLSISKRYNLLYASGFSCEELGQWMSNLISNREPRLSIAVMGDDMIAVIMTSDGPVFVENDFSRFDTTISRQALEFEFSIYEACGIVGDPVKVLRAQLKTTGYTTKGIRYHCDAGRKSGDPNTSCGNSLINGLVSMTILRELESLIIDKPNLAEKEVAEAYLKYGFKAKTKVSKDLSKVEFCSKVFWPTNHGLVLGPKPERVLPKIGMTIKKLNNVDVAGLLKGWWIDGGFVPGLYEYLDHASKFYDVSKAKANRIGREYSVKSRAEHKSTPETEAFFFERYGVPAATFRDHIRFVLKGAGQFDCVTSQMLTEIIRAVE